MNFLTADVAIVVDDSKLPAQLARAKRATKKTAMSMTKHFKKMGASFKTVFSKMARAAKLGSVAIVAALILSAKAAMKQEDAIFLLNSALKISGEYTDELAEQFVNFAAEIQQATIYGDEFVLSLMQQQRSLGVTADKLELAAKMAIGLATATGRGIESMSMYVALAMQGEFTMLRRYIPALRATTDATQQLAIVTKFAADGFKLAEDRAKTTSGGLKQLWNMLGDLTEILGAPLLRPLAEWSRKLKENKELAVAWAEVWADRIENVIKVFSKWRTEIGYTIAALGGLFIIVKITTWVVALSTAVGALSAAVVAASVATGVWAVSWFTMAGAMKSLAIQTGSATAMIASLKAMRPGKIITIWTLAVNRLKLALSGLSGILITIGLAIFTTYKLIKVVLLIGEWSTALDNVAKTEKRLAGVQERLAARRLEMVRKQKEEVGANRLVVWAKETKEKEQEVVKIDTNATENYTRMKDALQFEFDMLGKINDVRERAEALASVKAETDKMLTLSLEERNQLLNDYMILIDRLQTKQASFGHTIQLWMNDALEMGKNLGQVMTNAFDSASDALADFVLKGKADFNALAESILNDLMRMIIRAQIAQALGVMMGVPAPVTATAMAATAPPAGGTPTGLASGGTVTRTGWAKVDKGETFSGVGEDRTDQPATININVNAIDAQGTHQFLSKNKRQIASLIQGSITSNHPLRRAKGWK